MDCRNLSAIAPYPRLPSLNPSTRQRLPICEPRHGAFIKVDQMTIIYEDGKAPYKVIYEDRKRRKPARALKFGDVKVGDQLVRVCNFVQIDNLYDRRQKIYYLVTDRWFDPVAGQDDEVAGQMVGLRQIGPDGELRGGKLATTVRGLASQQYQYVGFDMIAQQKAAVAALKSREVIGMGEALKIRARPKTPSARF